MPLLDRRRVTLGVLAGLLVLLAASAVHPDGLRKALRNEEEGRRLERENAELEQAVVRLRREVRALRGDPAAIERAAREDLGYVRPGEIVYKFDEEGSR
jgi:cell division protein FtsB